MRSLSLEEFAIVLAHLEHFAPDQSPAVLTRLEVPQSAFLDAANTHPNRIAEDLAAGEQQSSETFQRALDGANQDLAAQKPSLDQLLPLAPSAPRALFAEIDGDRTVDAESARLAPSPMPFRDGPPMAAPAPELRPPTDRGDTAGLDAAPTDALPFGTPDFSSWTAEAYAAFTAERRWLEPDVVRSRYGVRDGADEHALIVHFNRRFAREPGLREQWTDLVQRRTRELTGVR